MFKKSAFTLPLCALIVLTVCDGTNRVVETNAIPLTVDATSPQDRAERVVADVHISCRFSADIDPITANTATFVLTADNGESVVPSIVSCFGRTATLISLDDLKHDATYTATVTTGIKDVDGNALQSDHSWSFTTIRAPLGRTWTMRESNTNEMLLGATWSGSLFVAVGRNASIVTSVDGVSWEVAESGISGTDSANVLYDVVWTNEQFVAVCDINSKLCFMLSSDGTAWRTVSIVPEFNGKLYDIVSTGEELVAAGSSRAIAWSDNGEEWVPHFSANQNCIFRGIGWSGSKFLAVGQCIDSTIYHGSRPLYAIGDRRNTHFHPSPMVDTEQLIDVTWSGAGFVVVGRWTHYFGEVMGTILTYNYPGSSSWWEVRNDLPDCPNAVWWDGITTYVVGDNGSILTSEDAEIWTNRNSGTDANLYGIASSDEIVIVVGDGGIILTSP